MNLFQKNFGEILANLWSNATDEANIFPNSKVNYNEGCLLDKDCLPLDFIL